MTWTHFDEQGNAVMTDVSDKEETKRVAVAEGTIAMSSEVIDKIEKNEVGKGDVLNVARIAGIMGTKRTGDLIPMCHPLFLQSSSIDFETDLEKGLIHAICTVKTCGKTGVEMEALTGVSVALLTIYDMCKAFDKGMVIRDIHLTKKTGGKSGEFLFQRNDR